MAVFLYSSSFRCDCGHECHFFENTVREMCKISKNKTQFLIEDGHCIEFATGKAVAVHCPTLGRCTIADNERE